MASANPSSASAGGDTDDRAHTALTLRDLLDGLQLQESGADGFTAANIDFYGKSSSSAASVIADVIWGGQLVGQSIMAAHARHPGSEVLSTQTVFMRGGRVSQPLTLAVDTPNNGRSFGAE